MSVSKPFPSPVQRLGNGHLLSKPLEPTWNSYKSSYGVPSRSTIGLEFLWTFSILAITRCSKGVPNGFQWSSGGFPKGFQWDSSGFPKGFQRGSGGFPKGFQRDSNGDPVGFQRGSKVVPIGFQRLGITFYRKANGVPAAWNCFL